MADAEASAAAAEALTEITAEAAVAVPEEAGAALPDTVPVVVPVPEAEDVAEETTAEAVLVDVP